MPSWVREGGGVKTCSKNLPPAVHPPRLSLERSSHDTFLKTEYRSAQRNFGRIRQILVCQSFRSPTLRLCGWDLSVPLRHPYICARADYTVLPPAWRSITRHRTSVLGHSSLNPYQKLNTRADIRRTGCGTNDVRRSMAVPAGSSHKRGQFVPPGLLYDHV